MSTDTVDQIVNKAGNSAADSIDKGQKALNEALAMAQQKIAETAKIAQKALREGAENLRTQSASYRENAGQQFDDAQRYVVERVKERPVTAALTGLGVGLLLGLLLSNNRR
ncbi:MAG TPA: hypothetical protein VGN38_09150 [Caulobacteraceae bacterium]|jgi:ElaB/YqjD/DUF883 family membrane-anchored ribosome-binding protein|nr:hypothetical protein [Caulobacteraceae bacterium]